MDFFLKFAVWEAQHQVERGRAAGAGEAATVYLEKLSRCIQVGEVLAEAGQVFPMDGAAIAVKQSGFGKGIAARGQGADSAATTGKPS